MRVCRLCESVEADNKNSHIIPKFMAKRLFEFTNPKHSLEIDRKGKSKKIQDTPKESFILCKGCEKRLAFLETLVSKKIVSINNFNNLPNQFELKQYGNNKILKCLDINPIEFAIFIFTVVWRVSISNLPQFESFKLDNKTENNLRLFLDSSIKTTHKELIDSISKILKLPNYDYCIFKPLFKNEFSRGIFTAYKMGEHQFGIFTVDYIIFFYTDEKAIHPALRLVSNLQTKPLLITLAVTKDWNVLNNLVIKGMLGQV